MNRKVCVVGSGPGGMYVAQGLLKKEPDTEIDILDRLPSPFGLIRGGVAPDHQTTKNVDKAFEKSLVQRGVRFLGNIEVGRDVSVAELLEIYDAVVLAYGAPYDRQLGIPGEDKAGVIGSNAFVGWYNCHPDFRDLDPNLDVETVAVIGIGNVAIDVARVLTKTPGEMAQTDIADYAAERIHAAPIKDVHMFGRRGPIEAAFTNVELREMGRLEQCAPAVDPDQLPHEVPETGQADRDRRLSEKNLQTLWSFTEADPNAKPKRVHFGFYASPVEILGGDRVEGVRLERTRVEVERAVGTGETFDLDCGLVITCIGSRADPIDGVPFDQSRGIVTHDKGKVAPSLYAAGWVKRGANGTIGTNKTDSDEVVDLLIQEFESDSHEGGPALDRLLRERNVRVVDFPDWVVIKRLEEEAASEGAPRRKFITVDEMLAVLEGSGSRPSTG